MSAKQRRRRESRRRNHSETSSAPRRLVLAGGLTAGATLAMAGVAQAAPMTFTVGTAADASAVGDCTTPANTDCSLRQAVGWANANAGADTIVFNSNLTGSTISLTTGELSITEAVNIDGGYATVDGGGSQRIFYVDPLTPGDPVAITNMTLTNGDAGSGNGGAVYNIDADLTILHAVISNSRATSIANQGGGGGVYTNTGALNISGSTISGNHAYQGGGVGSLQGGVTITDSTLTGNHADGDTTDNGNQGYGGGVFTSGADAIVTRSTIDHNVAAYDGGGIYSAQSGGSVTLTNSTLAGNQAKNDDGGGIWICCGESGDALTVVNSTVTGNQAATTVGGLESLLTTVSPELVNSIVSGNTSGTNPATDDVYAYTGSEFDASFSLIGVQGAYVNDVVGDVIGADPRLGPLADNGGPTKTMHPYCGSAAIDQGKDFSTGEDQRGEFRPVDLPGYPNSGAVGADGSDIGAFELQTSPGTRCVAESPTSKNFGNLTVGTASLPQNFTVTGIGPDPVHVASAALVGVNAGEFSKSSDGCSGATLNTNNSCTVGVVFGPSSTGAKAARVRLTGDVEAFPLEVSLSGNGIAVPPAPVTPTNPAPPTKKKCKKHKKHKRSAQSAKKKKCKKKKKK